MAPGNNDRHPGHTGTIPKTKARNNCNVPQEAVTPTRRDMTTNLVSTSLDWVPVSEYNTRGNYNQQSRKPVNNISDHELNDLDNSASFEGGFGRFVPVRPQPRVLPLNVQNQNLTIDNQDDTVHSSASGHSLHPYAHQMQNGLMPQSNHATAAVMIVNPTTPNAITGNISQPFNAPNQNRNNLTRNLNPARNNFEGSSHSSNNNTPPISNSRTVTKTVNIMNNMYDQGQGTYNNLTDNNGHRESARALGEAIVAACPDAAAVERRLGQIREYIRVTSSLVDTMRNSEDEAYIEHTKEEYDELVQMVMKLKESESKLESMLIEKGPDNIEVPAEEDDVATATLEPVPDVTGNTDQDKASNIKPDTDVNNLKKVTNLENEQINKTLHDNKVVDVSQTCRDEPTSNTLENNDDEHKETESNTIEIQEVETIPLTEDSKDKNEVLRQNIISCVEKVALIEELKNKKKDGSESDNQDVVVRPVSVQSNGSAYSENELWQNEIKNKMEMSQIRLTTLKQQQKRLLKYQEEAKQQLDEMNRQSQDIHPSTSHDHYTNMSGQAYSNNHHTSNRMYTANQIGVATTLPHGADAMHGQSASVNGDTERFSSHSGHSHDERYSGRAADPRDSDDEPLGDRARDLHAKLRDLQLKKQHMENLVSEFQKLQAATARAGSSRNTYSSSGEDSGADEATGKFAPPKPLGNVKNEDPFKLMEIKAIKTALQKTKDLMRSVENYEVEHLAQAAEEALHAAGHGSRSNHSNHAAAHDSKSEGGGSLGGWSNDGSLCRVRNQLPPPRTPDARDKFNNERHSLQQHHNHEENIATLQELAQELRIETEKIMGERARIKDMVANKEPRRQKKVNEEVRAGGGAPGPAERRQMQLRALLADKQRELEALLTKEKVLSGAAAGQQAEAGAGCSYGSEPEEPDSVSEPPDAPHRAAADSACRLPSVSSRRGSVYGSDSDSASRNKLNQRNRRRRQPQERQVDDNSQQISSIQNMRNDSRDSSNVNLVPPISQSDSPANVPYPHLPPPSWNTTKSNQDMRNQFTQNSHSQTMDRLLGTPQMSFPPTMPYNMMMPYGMSGGCGCGCGVWGAWCWQQLALQQRDILQLREQVTHLEERWRAENASHTLNNQVPPGNRANNYWDNFRSYSRQNLLSTSSKTNAEVAPPPPSLPPKRNAPAARPQPKRNAPAHRPPPPAHSHDNNFNSPANLKKKSSSKLPAKNSSDRNNYASTLDYSQTSNVNIASTSDAPNPNLASASREPDDKATSKLFDLLRENVYSEVTALIGVNESHPDFLIQLFRELQMISSDPLRQRVLRSIMNVLSQYDSIVESQSGETERSDAAADAASTADERGCRFVPTVYSGDMQIDGKIIRFLLGNREDTCNAELLDTLTSLILSTCDRQTPQTRQKLLEFLFKFEGMRLSEVSGDIVETLPVLLGGGEDGPEAAALQDVAGALEPYAAGDARPDACPYEMWPGHVHVDVDGADDASPPSSRDGNGDLINCSEIQNGDLAEADQTCASDGREDEAAGGPPALGDELDADDQHQAGPASKGLHCVDYET